MKQSLLLAVILLATATALGDGGAMLLHQDAGPFTVTLFAAPQPLQTGTGDISVMVQDRASNQTLLYPVVEVSLDQQPAVRLQAGLSSNKLMQSASVQFTQAGRHQLSVVVRRGQDVAQLSTSCSVEAGYSRATLVWFYLLLPAVAIVLFVLQQTLKMRHSR